VEELVLAFMCVYRLERTKVPEVIAKEKFSKDQKWMVVEVVRTDYIQELLQ
jgi:hypothetical protein